MNAEQKKLYLELRTIRKELVERLERKESSSFIRPIIEDELRDIDETLAKVENGKYGFCEVSGELIPKNILMMMPTIKSYDDMERIEQYFCKPIYT